MITGLRVKNFKSHRDTAINLGGLTLLTGTNSSGKSSLIHALLLLRQSFLKGRLFAGLDLNEPLCRIGTGHDALYRAAENAMLSIEITEGTASFRFAYDAGAALTGTFLPKGEYGGNVTSEALEQSPLFTDEFQYVSALRTGGRSHFEQYDYEVAERRQVSREFGQGECVAHYLHRFGGEPSDNYLCDGKEYALADQTVLWLRRISEGLTVEVKKSSSGGFDVVYGYAFSGLKPLAGLRAENIGYGVSHALPVVVALLSAKPGGLVVLENPEAHLHPRGQAELAQLMARVAQNGVQVIVETHSDHIFNGVLVATKRFEDGDRDNRGLDREKTRIYHVDKNPAVPMEALAEEIQIEAGGRVKFQPRGFFDQAEKDLGLLMGF